MEEGALLSAPRHSTSTNGVCGCCDNVNELCSCTDNLCDIDRIVTGGSSNSFVGNDTNDAECSNSITESCVWQYLPNCHPKSDALITTTHLKDEKVN